MVYFHLRAPEGFINLRGNIVLVNGLVLSFRRLFGCDCLTGLWNIILEESFMDWEDFLVRFWTMWRFRFSLTCRELHRIMQLPEVLARIRQLGVFRIRGTTRM